MNRAELVAAVSDRSGQPRQAVEEVLGVLGEVVGDALVAGEKVSLPGFLTAERVERGERQGRNPQTGEPMTIAASSGVKLSAVSALKTHVKGR
ncbi:MAG TPA: HU family DNA-binding protein [Mycobacteriales bacterium]|nr:HU family DNA-binding protein [Mycobacteriales bacterium]